MRFHVFIALICIGMIPAICAGWIIQSAYIQESISLKISDAQTYASRLANQVIYSGYLTNTGGTNINTETKLIASIYNGRVIIVDSNLKVLSDTFEREVGKTLISDKVIECLRGNNSITRNKNSRLAEMTIPIVQGDSETIVGVIIFNISLEREFKILSTLDQKVTIVLTFIFIVLVIAAFIYSKSLAKPLKAIIASINHVTEGYMDDEVSIKGFYEIEQISDSFNAMLTRIKTLEESRQEFVSNVSHELKTPITSIKVLADSLLMQEDTPVEIYREFMQDINDEIERENKIINDLLSLVKLDKKTGEMHIAEVSINELLEIILKRLKPIAMKRNIELVFESFRPVLAEVDEVKLSLAVSNLIENAIKYNVDDGWVRVSLNADHKYFYIKVSDSGIGIPESAINNIFDRFYRVDKARTRQTGGTGLGLSITKNVILMHNGAVKVYSKENEGTTFTIRVPLSYIA